MGMVNLSHLSCRSHISGLLGLQWSLAMALPKYSLRFWFKQEYAYRPDALVVWCLPVKRKALIYLTTCVRCYRRWGLYPWTFCARVTCLLLSYLFDVAERCRDEKGGSNCHRFYSLLWQELICLTLGLWHMAGSTFLYRCQSRLAALLLIVHASKLPWSCLEALMTQCVDLAYLLMIF